MSKDLYINNSFITDIYAGSSAIECVYKNGELIWKRPEGPTVEYEISYGTIKYPPSGTSSSPSSPITNVNTVKFDTYELTLIRGAYNITLIGGCGWAVRTQSHIKNSSKSHLGAGGAAISGKINVLRDITVTVTVGGINTPTAISIGSLVKNPNNNYDISDINSVFYRYIQDNILLIANPGQCAWNIGINQANTPYGVPPAAYLANNDTAHTADIIGNDLLMLTGTRGSLADYDDSSSSGYFSPGGHIAEPLYSIYGKKYGFGGRANGLTTYVGTYGNTKGEQPTGGFFKIEWLGVNG